MEELEFTTFDDVEDMFLSKITDDMFMELTLEDTQLMMDELLINALPWFEFPRNDIFDYNRTERIFNIKLTNEEINIISHYMVCEWIGQQLATIELIKQKYSGSDFKFTSQASHIKQLVSMKNEYEREGFHLQRVYCRRKRGKDGSYKSTFTGIMAPRSW